MKLNLTTSKFSVKGEYYVCGSHEIELEIELEGIDGLEFMVRILDEHPEVISELEHHYQQQLQHTQHLIMREKELIDKYGDLLP